MRAAVGCLSMCSLGFKSGRLRDVITRIDSRSLSRTFLFPLTIKPRATLYFIDSYIFFIYSYTSHKNTYTKSCKYIIIDYKNIREIESIRNGVQ